MDLKRGTQIAYRPDHVSKEHPDWINHDDVDFGFVMSKAGPEAYFCRYWDRRNPIALRTMANSEATHISNIEVFDFTEQILVDHVIKVIIANPEIYGVTRENL